MKCRIICLLSASTDLLLVGRESEDVLHISAHVERFQHLVTFVQDEMLDVFEIERTLSGKRQDTSGSTDHNVRAILLEGLFILLNGHATEKDGCLDVWHVLGESVILLGDLERQLSSVTKDDDAHLAVDDLELLEGG